MVTHLVFFNIKDEAEGLTKPQIAAELKRQLEALPALIPEIKELRCGTDFTASPVSWDFGLFTTFETPAALDIYVDHPDHVLVKNFIFKVTSARAIVDFEN